MVFVFRYTPSGRKLSFGWELKQPVLCLSFGCITDYFVAHPQQRPSTACIELSSGDAYSPVTVTSILLDCRESDIAETSFLQARSTEKINVSQRQSRASLSRVFRSSPIQFLIAKNHLNPIRGDAHGYGHVVIHHTKTRDSHARPAIPP